MSGKTILLMCMIALLSACAPGLLAPTPAATVLPTLTAPPTSTNTPLPTATETLLPTLTRTPTPIPKPTLEIFPFGKFEAKYDGSIVGNTFNPGGTWNGTFDNRHRDGGTFKIKGFQIEIFSTGCQFGGYDPIGIYAWSFDGETLAFKRVSDNCDVRARFMRLEYIYVP